MRRLDTIRGAVGLLALLMGTAQLAGCDEHGGRVLVVVHSDYPVPAELSEVRVLAGPADDPEDKEGHAFRLTRVTPPPVGTHGLPLSLMVTPRDGRSDRHVEIVVEGRSAASGEVLVSVSRVLEGFRPGETIVLPVFLSRACEGMICDAESTCVDGGCVPRSVDPADLPSATEPGEEIRVDAGADTGADAAADTGLDTGASPDVGMDASADSGDGGVVDAMSDARPDADADSSAPADTGVDAGPCGPPVTRPYTVIEGPDTLFPLAPPPGEWAYSARLSAYDTYVAWDFTAPAGCEVYRVEPAVPEGMPADPFADCSRTCAEQPTFFAHYEIYLDGSPAFDEIITGDHSVAAGSVRLNLRTPSQQVRVMLSDWTDERPDTRFVVFHDAVFYSRPQ